MSDSHIRVEILIRKRIRSHGQIAMLCVALVGCLVPLLWATSDRTLHVFAVFGIGAAALTLIDNVLRRRKAARALYRLQHGWDPRGVLLYSLGMKSKAPSIDGTQGQPNPDLRTLDERVASLKRMLILFIAVYATLLLGIGAITWALTDNEWVAAGTVLSIAAISLCVFPIGAKRFRSVGKWSTTSGPEDQTS